MTDPDMTWWQDLDRAQFSAEIAKKFKYNKPETPGRSYRYLSEEGRLEMLGRASKGGKQTKQRGTNVGRG
jgi:hypothetical protein